MIESRRVILDPEKVTYSLEDLVDLLVEYEVPYEFISRTADEIFSELGLIKEVTPDGNRISYTKRGWHKHSPISRQVTFYVKESLVKFRSSYGDRTPESKFKLAVKLKRLELYQE